MASADDVRELVTEALADPVFVARVAADAMSHADQSDSLRVIVILDVKDATTLWREFHTYAKVRIDERPRRDRVQLGDRIRP